MFGQALISFIIFMLAFAVIGGLATLKSKNNIEDYLVASRDVPAWLAGLSAVATNNSGYMFIGMIGYTYSDGLKTIWLMIGWVLGDLIISLICLKPMIKAARETNSRSLGSLLSNWLGNGQLHSIRWFSGILTIIFLTFYSAAQFKAGGIALHTVFHWQPTIGILIGAVIVVLYCFSGGIRASIWTDAAQSIVMIFGMLALLFFGYTSVSNLTEKPQLPDGYFNLFPDGFSSAILFIVGWFFGGAGVIGQPHIVSRFISLKSDSDVFKMRCYYYAWFTSFYAMTIGVGLLCRYLIPNSENFKSETALPVLSTLLFNGVGVGLILAAIFAATISTADSLILACTASMEEEINIGKKDNLLRAKITTLVVLIIAICIAIANPQNVFKHVLMSWGLLASAFCPVIILRSANRIFTDLSSIITVLSGVLIFCLFKYNVAQDLMLSVGVKTSYFYEVLPGIFLGCCIGLLLSKKKVPQTKVDNI